MKLTKKEYDDKLLYLEMTFKLFMESAKDAHKDGRRAEFEAKILDIRKQLLAMNRVFRHEREI